VRLVVGLDDARGDATALVDRVTVGPGPLADLRGAVVAGAATGAAATSRAAPTDAAEARGVRAEVFSSRGDPEQLARIAELVDAGEVRVELAEVLPLSEVRRAHELSESGHTRGKIVLTVST